MELILQAIDYFFARGPVAVVNSLVTITLCVLGIWGLYGFYPRRWERGNNGPSWLILAVWIGFLGATLNVFYWRLLTPTLRHFEIVTGPTSTDAMFVFGTTYGDIVFKGLGAVSIYMHFYARYASLKRLERRFWTPLSMALYPSTSSLAYRTLTYLKRRHKGQRAEDNKQG